jgi:DNA-binding NtrC family response regulator
MFSKHVSSRQFVSLDEVELEGDLIDLRLEKHLTPQGTFASLRSARKQFERNYIALVLLANNGRVEDAAQALGIQRTNLYRKARQLGLKVGRFN